MLVPVYKKNQYANFIPILNLRQYKILPQVLHARKLEKGVSFVRLTTHRAQCDQKMHKNAYAVIPDSIGQLELSRIVPMFLEQTWMKPGRNLDETWMKLGADSCQT